MNMSIRFLKQKNRWYVDIRHNGQRIRKPSPDNTKASAQYYESFLRQELAKHGTIEHLESLERDKKREQTTFSSFADRWHKEYVQANNKHSECLAKACIMNKHLKPYFGKIPLKDISTEKCEQYKSSKQKAEYSPKSINNQLATLRKCLVTAEEWGLIDRTPKIRLLRVNQPPPRFLSDTEIDKLLVTIDDQEVRTMVLMALRTGMRHGELIALQWEDVDLQNGRICVKRNSVKGREGTTKNGRARHAPITSDLSFALRKLPRRCHLVFPGVQNNVMHHAITSRWINAAFAKAGIKATGWHILRHTFASQLVSRGATLKAVQELLGHATINMTLRYAHLAPERLHETIKLLEPVAAERPKQNIWAPNGHLEINRSPEVLEKLLSQISFSSPK